MRLIPWVAGHRLWRPSLPVATVQRGAEAFPSVETRGFSGIAEFWAGAEFGGRSETRNAVRALICSGERFLP